MCYSLDMETKTRYVSNHTSASKFISERREFDGNSMSARNSPAGSVGRLPGAWRSVYYNTVNDIDYIVYSFNTPIAWHTPYGWLIPRITYSSYTARHFWYVYQVALSENDPFERIEADMYYHDFEIMHRVIELKTHGRCTNLMHTGRQYDYVTIRGIRNGDYVQSEDGVWRAVYAKELVNDVFGSRYWRVSLMLSDAAIEKRHIGTANNRVGRLRA